MNRLTDTSRNSRNCNSGKLYGCYEIQQAITKLADYEDTGFEPSEIAAIKAENEHLHKSFNNISRRNTLNAESQLEFLKRTDAAAKRADVLESALGNMSNDLMRAIRRVKHLEEMCNTGDFQVSKFDFKDCSIRDYISQAEAEIAEADNTKNHTEIQIKMDLNKLAKDVHENACAHGWYDENRTFGEIIALCHSELSEALEEYRNGQADIYYKCKHPTYSLYDHFDPDGGICKKRKTQDEWICPAAELTTNETCIHAKPEGIAVELADCIIRILDYCGYAKIDIEKAIAEKHEYNKKRPYRHGGKKI